MAENWDTFYRKYTSGFKILDVEKRSNRVLVLDWLNRKEEYIDIGVFLTNVMRDKLCISNPSKMSYVLSKRTDISYEDFKKAAMYRKITVERCQSRNNLVIVRSAYDDSVKQYTLREFFTTVEKDNLFVIDLDKAKAAYYSRW